MLAGKPVVTPEAADEAVGQWSARVCFCCGPCHSACHVQPRAAARAQRSPKSPIEYRRNTSAGAPAGPAPRRNGASGGGETDIFKVKGNNGSLAGGKRQVAVVSSASGHAETPFQLGTLEARVAARFIVTIQPAGARFEPPAGLTLPNLESLAPGEVTELYSFDHDLGHFVSIGPATVSEDGTIITSNPGVGIVKAGWHCGGSPGFTGSSDDCPACHSCVLNWCTADDTQPCDQSDPCKTNSRCSGGSCIGDDVTVTSIGGPCFGEVGLPATFSAVSNAPEKLEWQASPDANPAKGFGASFTASFAAEGSKLVSAGCPKGDSKYKSFRVLPTCGNIATDIQWKQHHPAVDCFGMTRPITRSFRHKICASSNKACLRLEYLQIDYVSEVPLSCAIDVPSRTRGIPRGRRLSTR